MTFQDQCRQAAAAFLKTVVLVDDRASFSGHVQEAVAEDADALEEPGELDAVSAEGGKSEPVRGGGADLDAGAITRGFAENGIVCAVLKPEDGKPLTEQALKAAHAADVLVVDWEMMDDGQNAINIIQQLLTEDAEAGGRLRLIAIYTGRGKLEDIPQKIKTCIGGLEQQEKNLTLVNGAGTTKIIVLSKGEGSKKNSGEQPVSRVSEEKLADHLIDEFASFAGGILPNTAMASIGHLRNNTHRLLERFNKHMDGPLISHHALCGSPPDAIQYVSELIVQEIEAQVPLKQVVKKFAGIESISVFLESDQRSSQEPKIRMVSGDEVHEQKISTQLVADIMSHGLENEDIIARILEETQKSKNFYKKALSKRHELFYLLNSSNFEDAAGHHGAFSKISCVKRALEDVDLSDLESFPTLKLGSIVHDGKYYFICITPVCDSVRLKDKDTNFTFARLEKSEDEFGFVIPDVDGLVRLSINRKRAYFISYDLEISDQKDVRACRKVDAETLVFRPAPVAADGSQGPELRWIADLKPMQAQRVVSSLTAHLSRVGLDEFEWLRLQSPKWS
jgi:hypothetical protein